MRCPYCGLELADPRMMHCPRCGQTLQASPPPTGPDATVSPVASDPWTTPGASSSSAPQGPGGQGGYGTPAYPSTPWQYGAPGSPPSTAYPSYPAYPGYGQGTAGSYPPPYGAPPSMPLYGQSGQSGQFGQWAPPSMPMYGSGPGVPPGYAAPPSMPAPLSQSGLPSRLLQPLPERKSSRKGVFAAVGAVLAIVVCSALAVAAMQGTTAFQSASSAGSSANNAAPGTTATPRENVIFTDPMTGASHEADWASNADCFFQDDGYHVMGGWTCYAPVDALSNGVISVDAEQISGDSRDNFGLAFRRTSKGNFYVFGITTDGYWAVGKVVNDQYNDIVPYVANTAIHTGLHTKNTLKVVATGSHFAFYANGTQIGQADDSTFSSGVCGVSVGNGRVAVFTNFSVALLQ